MSDPISNQPKVLVEFSPEEISWLADRLHELRESWNAALLFKAQGMMSRAELPSENEKRMMLSLEDHKKTEAKIRNRLVDKAAAQGFGDL